MVNTNKETANEHGITQTPHDGLRGDVLSWQALEEPKGAPVGLRAYLDGCSTSYHRGTTVDTLCNYEKFLGVYFFNSSVLEPLY